MNDELAAARRATRTCSCRIPRSAPRWAPGFKGQVDTYRYRMDYAWADQGRLGHSHRMSVGLSF